MATDLKRLLTLCLALIFFVSVTAQLVPCGMAQAEMTIPTGMADGCSAAKALCTGHIPTCIDHIGCVTAPALPVSSLSFSVAFAWTSLDYDLAPEALSGISVKPELSPPILAA